MLALNLVSLAIMNNCIVHLFEKLEYLSSNVKWRSLLKQTPKYVSINLK